MSAENNSDIKLCQNMSIENMWDILCWQKMSENMSTDLPDILCCNNTGCWLTVIG